MQLRLTVLGPQSGTATATDVTVTAPEGTVLATVLGGLADATAPGSGPPGSVYCGSERLDPRHSVLGRAPLVDGAMLAFQHPFEAAAPPMPDGSQPRILVLSGPDAGGVHLLHCGEISIGRSADADVPIDDPDVSRLHCVLGVTEHGTLTVRDAGSTNGTVLDGSTIGELTQQVPHGAELRIGESVLQLLEGDGSAQTGAGATGGTRPETASDGPDSPSQDVPASSPGSPTSAPEETRGTGHRVTRGRRRGAPDASPHPPRGIPSLPPAVERAALPAAEGAAEAERWPDPASVLLTAVSSGPRRWERDSSHRDAFTVRLGTAQRAAGPLMPVTVNLATIGSLGLAGPWPRLAALARSILGQLATLHHPEALEIVVVAPDRAAAWSWLGWLPHTRPTRGQECHRLLGFDREQAAARLTELTARLPHAADPAGPSAPATVARQGADGSGVPRTVVLVDGPPDTPRVCDQLAQLAAAGPEAGVHLLALADVAPATPASPLSLTLAAAKEHLPVFGSCGMVGVLAGEVATAVRLLLPNGEPGPPGTIDGVSTPLAERLARALAPRTGGGSGGNTDHPTAAGLPATARLLDLLELPRITPGALRERWASADDSLPLVLGAKASGALRTDLASAPGPLLIDGPSRSGRSELLCSLAASLVASRSPEKVSLVLIDGADEALQPCADLPHVTERLRTTEPLRMRAFAQALRGELNRRVALLGEYDFDHWTAVGDGEGSASAAPLRVVEPRAAPDDGPALPWPDGSAAGEPLRRLVVFADNVAELRAPALGAPGRPAAGSVVRALEAVVREGPRLGVHLVATSEPAEWEVALRVSLAGRPVGRGEFAPPDGRSEPFQAARATGRIPRTATLRPTVTPLDWRRMGDPPKRRPVRELGNGPTDIALLASAAERADQRQSPRAVSPA